MPAMSGLMVTFSLLPQSRERGPILYHYFRRTSIHHVGKARCRNELVHVSGRGRQLVTLVTMMASNGSHEDGEIAQWIVFAVKAR